MGVCRDNNSGGGVLWRVNNTIAIGVLWPYSNRDLMGFCRENKSGIGVLWRVNNTIAIGVLWPYSKKWFRGSLSREQQRQWWLCNVRTTVSLLLFSGLGSNLASREFCQVKVTIPLLHARTTIMPMEFSGVRRTLTSLKCSDFSITLFSLDFCAVINHLKC